MRLNNVNIGVNVFDCNRIVNKPRYTAGCGIGIAHRFNARSAEILSRTGRIATVTAVAGRTFNRASHFHFANCKTVRNRAARIADYAAAVHVCEGAAFSAVPASVRAVRRTPRSAEAAVACAYADICVSIATRYGSRFG